MIDELNLQNSINNDNKTLSRMTSDPKLKYKKNFSFSYDSQMIEVYKKKNPEIINNYKQQLIKKEPWLKYQSENLNKKVNQLILPSVLEKREGISRKNVGADLKHLSYSENHLRSKYGDVATRSKDVNFGIHTTLDGIVGESQKTIYIDHINESIVFDPCLVSVCLERLKRDNGKIRDFGIENDIYLMYLNKQTNDEILNKYKDIDEKDLFKFINNIQDYEVICMVYSLNGFEKITQEQIAYLFNITQPAVIKRLNRAKNRFLEFYIEIAKETGNEFE